MKKKMPLERWVRLLRSGRKFYKAADLIKLSGLAPRSCRVSLSRLVKKGLLVKLGKEFFGSTLVPFSPEEAVCQSYLPSYLSCEYVLSRHGVIDQMPYAYTAVTLRRSKKKGSGETDISYEHLRKNLFWGYVSEGDAFVAEPEKALLDWLYLRRGEPDLTEIHWEEMDLGRLRSYSGRFPRKVQKRVAPFVGSG